MARSHTPSSPTVPEDENPIDATTVHGADDARAQLLKLVSDPEVALQLGRTLATTAEGKALLGIPANKGPATGVWRRNYDGEEALKVYGGVEVRHDADFEPNPPGYIHKYVMQGGGETDTVKAPIGNDGTPIGRDAELDEHGRPVKTAAYRRWLDVRLAGKRLDSRVQTDMAVGTFQETSVGFDPLVPA